MIAQKNDLYAPPAKPMMKPLSDIEIQDDFCLDSATTIILPEIWNSKPGELSEMETEESACGDEQSTPEPRKRHLQDLFSSSVSKRCMMSKLERMDRAQCICYAGQQSEGTTDGLLSAPKEPKQ